MKFPNPNIFWECVASSFLDVKDMARLEYALDCKSTRSELSLHNQPIRESKCHAYDSITLLDSNEVAIDSLSKLLWCQSRQLRVVNVKLLVDPSLASDQDSETRENINYFCERDRWDILNHICTIEVWCHITNIEDMLHRLRSVRALTWVSVTANGILMKTLTKIRNDVSKISAMDQSSPLIASPNILQDLSRIGISSVGSTIRDFDDFISSYPSITSAKLASNRLADDHLRSISQNWQKLSTLRLVSNVVSDQGLRYLSESPTKLQSLSLSKCYGVSYEGLTCLMNSSLQELRLSQITLSIDEIRSLVSACISLRILELSCITSVLYCDDILHTIVTNCPLITTLILPRYGGLGRGNDPIDQLTKGCKDIEVLYLGRLPILTFSNITQLAKAYKHSLREITLMKVPNMETALKSFASCRHRVKLNINATFD